LIFDTNALSAFIDGDEAICQVLVDQPRAAIPVIVVSEFRYGITVSRHRMTYERWLEDHLEGFELLPVSVETTVPYARLRADLKRLGKPIPANDAWIAALSLQYGLPVISRDEHFDVIPGVRRISW